MNLFKKLDGLLAAHEARTETSQVLFGKLIAVTFEMAKRIEALEQREHSHPLGVGSLAQRRG